MSRDLRRRAGRRWIWAVLVVLVAAAAVLGLVLLPSSGQPTIAAEPAYETPAPGIVPVADPGPVIDPQALAAALAPVVANPALGTFSGIIGDGTAGTVLWSADPDRPMIPASTAKILTAAAALLVLPTDGRLTTSVVAGANGDAVLVGSGDPTLTATDPTGYFPGAARIADLAAGIRSSGTPVDRVVVDISLYEGPDWASGWFPEDIAGGYITPIQPVMLDAARLDPAVDESPRSATPALDAGRALATALGLDPAQVILGDAPADAPVLASVDSAPLLTRLQQMIGGSDNVLAEAIGRQVAQAAGRPASFAGADDAILSTLRDAGFSVDGVVMADASGLSEDDRVSANLLGAIISSAAGPADAPNTAALRPLLDMLPVAGATGTLADRYVGADRTGAGWIRAKTGTLTVAGALVGYVTDVNGRVLTFALMSNGSPPEAHRPALDAVAQTLRRCGCV